MTHNPSWTREEMILALDLYHRVDPLKVGPDHPAVIQLSERLRAFPFHPPATRARTFRNPTGIVMTLRTLMRHDPARGRRGLRGGRLGRDLWQEFDGRRIELQRLAEAIVTAAGVLQAGDVLGDGETFEEGGVLFRLHRRRERNRRLVASKKAQAMRKHGTLACEACGFDFAQTYGECGEGYVECHHCRPLSEVTKRGPVRLDEVALVCANCHRMLHRGQPLMSVAQLQAVIRRV